MNFVKKVSLLSVFAFLAFSCSKKRTLEQDTYNFEKEETLHYLGEFKIQTFGDEIIFHPSHHKLNTPLSYPDNFKVFNFNGIYRIERKDQEYYFRFGWMKYYKEQSIFQHLHWINKKPQFSEDFKTYKIYSVHVPFLQHGNITLCTIGDSQTWFWKAQKLRKEINNLNKNIVFVGSNVDIYGYPNDGEGGNTAGEVLNRISRIPKADYYTLLIGTNDWNKNFDKAYENTIAIVDYLLNEYEKAQILYLTPLPTTNKPRDEFNLRLSKKLQTAFFEKSRIKVVDIGKSMRKNENWEKDYLTIDGLHPNDEGVRFMAKKIAGQCGKP